METTKTRLHPLLTAAAISVTVFSAVGVAALTGALPHSRGSSAPAATISPETAIEHAVSMPVPPAPDAAPVQLTKPQPRPVARATSPRRTPQTAPRPADPVQVAQAVKPLPAPLPGIAATIEAVKEVEQAGDAKGVGAVAGGVAGAVLGGAGGAVLGHQIEKSARATKHWETTVRLESGTTQTISTEGEPAWHAGDHVRVVDGQILKS